MYLLKMKRLSLILSLLLLCVGAICAAENPAQTLRRSAGKLKSAKSLHVTYTAVADGYTHEGTLVIQGDMFIISSPQMKSWYDGKTQWTYASQIGEVNIITPTSEEVRQINPLAIISSFTNNYTATALKSAPGTSSVLLTARNPKADIRSADITVDDKSLYPTRLLLTMSNNQTVTIDIKDIRAGDLLPADNFRFNKSRYPDVQVVDLR